MSASEPNGGFPEPQAGEPVRVVRSTHPGCGGETRVRLPIQLPPRVVRRVVCARCERPYAAVAVEEVAGEETGAAPAEAVPAAPTEAPAAEPAAPSAPEAPEAAPAKPGERRPPIPFRLPPPESPVWRWVGIPVAALLVVATLVLLQGGGDGSPEDPGAVQAPGDPGSGAKLVVKPRFSLALPPGWEETTPERGPAFTARAPGGSADATLWIERAPNLSFAEFEARSTERLRSAGGEVEVVERIEAPDQEGQVVRLRAEPPGEVSAPHEVTLRAAGPLRFYLATTVQPGAPGEVREGAELIHESFIPGGNGAPEGGAP